MRIFPVLFIFVTVSQVIGYEDCLQNDLNCVGWALISGSSERSKN